MSDISDDDDYAAIEPTPLELALAQLRSNGQETVDIGCKALAKLPLTDDEQAVVAETLYKRLVWSDGRSINNTFAALVKALGGNSSFFEAFLALVEVILTTWVWVIGFMI